MYITIDESDRRPIYRQVADEIKGLIARGELREGMALPPGSLVLERPPGSGPAGPACEGCEGATLVGVPTEPPEPDPPPVDPPEPPVDPPEPHPPEEPPDPPQPPYGGLPTITGP